MGKVYLKRVKNNLSDWNCEDKDGSVCYFQGTYDCVKYDCLGIPFIKITKQEYENAKRKK